MSQYKIKGVVFFGAPCPPSSWEKDHLSQVYVANFYRKPFKPMTEKIDVKKCRLREGYGGIKERIILFSVNLGIKKI